MPPFEIEFAIIQRTLNDDAHIAEALFFPEVSRYGDDPERLKRAIIRNCIRALEEQSPNLLFRRTLPESIETFELNLQLDPPARRLNWQHPIDLRLDVMRWSHGEHAHIAFIPALGIEVISNKLDVLTTGASMLENHARAELMRRRATTNLLQLMMLERTRGLSVARVRSMASIRTPKQIALSSGRPEEKKSSALEQSAHDLTKQKFPPAYEVDDTVARLAEALTGKSGRSVLLVGKAGVGKTAVFHELVRRRADLGLGTTPFWATSGSRLVAGMSGFGMWQERCDALWREAEMTNAVVHFGNLVELMDTGKHEHNAQGLASFFRQRFMRSQALAVVECTLEQLPLIEHEDPALLKAFTQVTVDEPSIEAGRKILKQVVENYAYEIAITNRKEWRRQVRQPQPIIPPITDEGLDTLDRLHRRYAGYSAYPGRPLRFMRGLLQDRATAFTQQPPFGAREVTEAFAKETGLPLFLLDDATSYDSQQTYRWFAERVIGQEKAVALIVDLLATVKAGLTRPRHPIASLLFAGPTGVGKTEMAKSLARFFFGDEGRMARFDMSEYADALAVTRLVGAATGGEGTLTARIREQPFSVVLFDEFEKAHHSFFDLLLQTLGEGRLTDGRGRLADFSNSIIIMTYNLGAVRFRRSRLGFSHSGPDAPEAEQKYFRLAQKHFTQAVQDFLRPEILNRIDHIMPFLPLARDTVERIAGRELSLIEQRDGIRLRGVTLRVGKEVVESLARRGYDSHYGARPLKRLVERELLLPLSKLLNCRPPSRKSGTLIADVHIEGTHIRVRLQEETKKQRDTTFHDESSQAARVKRLGDIRRRVQRLGRSSAVIELHNSIWRLKQIEQRIIRAARRAKVTRRQAGILHTAQNPLEASALARLAQYQKLAGALNRLEEGTAAAEDEALLVLYGVASRQSETNSIASQLETGLHHLLADLLDLRYSHPNRITLAIYSENQRSLFELARGYFTAAYAVGMTVKIAYYTAGLPPDALKEEGIIEMFARKVARVEAPAAESFLFTAPDGTTGIILGIEGKSAYATYEGEPGLHAFIEDKAIHNLFVHTSEISFQEYKAPPSLERRASINPASHGERRRVYHRTEGYIADRLLDERREWQGNSVDAIRRLSATLKDLIEMQHERSAEKLIDS
jgi:ATP-dependent Clp protease ATP-binding subunit ClpA